MLLTKAANYKNVATNNSILSAKFILMLLLALAVADNEIDDEFLDGAVNDEAVYFSLSPRTQLESL